MKDGWLYIVFVFCALMLIASAQSDKEQLYNEESSVEYLAGEINMVGTITEFNFSLKKVGVISHFKFIYDKISDTAKANSNNCLLAANFKQHRAKIFGVPCFRRKISFLKIFKICEKEDNYHLS